MWTSCPFLHPFSGLLSHVAPFWAGLPLTLGWKSLSRQGIAEPIQENWNLHLGCHTNCSFRSDFSKNQEDGYHLRHPCWLDYVKVINLDLWYDILQLRPLHCPPFTLWCLPHPGAPEKAGPRACFSLSRLTHVLRAFSCLIAEVPVGLTFVHLGDMTRGQKQCNLQFWSPRQDTIQWLFPQTSDSNNSLLAILGDCVGNTPKRRWWLGLWRVLNKAFCNKAFAFLTWLL